MPLFGRKKEKRVYDDDDGHVIANMNVEGMPWYRKETPDQAPKSETKFTKEQSRYIILGTIKAALLIAGVFLLAFLVVIGIMCLVAKLRYG